MALILIENFRAVFYTPFYAAFALKAYEAGGVEVRRVMSTTPAETTQALRSGQADVAWGGPIRLLLANNQLQVKGGILIGVWDEAELASIRDGIAQRAKI